MAKDFLGQELRVGDEVVVLCKIETIQEVDGHPNLELRTVRKMFPSDQYGSHILVGGHQVFSAAGLTPYFPKFGTDPEPKPPNVEEHPSGDGEEPTAELVVG